jgi:glucose dehydrogenase
MADKKPEPVRLDGAEYLVDFQMPDASDQVMFYPSRPTPEFESKIARDRIIGTAAVVLGLALVIAGFILVRSEISTYFGVAILVLSILSFVFTILFLRQGSIPLIKTAAALPIIGYVIIVVVTIYHISRLPFIINLDWETVLGAMPELGDFIMLIGLYLLRGSAILLFDIHKTKTYFSPSVIIIGPAAISTLRSDAKPAQTAQKPDPQPQTAPKASQPAVSPSPQKGENVTQTSHPPSSPPAVTSANASNLCKNCSKELEPQYQICPFCGAPR